MYRRKGWSKKGCRCRYSINGNTRKNYSGIFIINSEGIINYKIYKGAVNGNLFIDFLKTQEKEKIGKKELVMDNLRTHHMKKVKEYLEEIETKIHYMPPYSPELNPIEEMFSWIKIKLREKNIKNEKELEKTIKELAKEIKIKGLKKYYDHSYQ